MASAILRSFVSYPPELYRSGQPKFIRRKLGAIHVSMTRSENDPSPEFRFEDYSAVKIKQINKALDAAIPLHQQPTILQEAMRYTLLAGGKRIPSSICMASCELVGGNDSAVLPMACALEMIWTMAVVQDDLPCLDNDDLRRGKPANHKVFGEATSILACQALLCLAIEQIASKTKRVPPEHLVRAILELCTAVGSRGVAAGQIMDMHSEGTEVSLSELETIHRHKTGNFMEAAAACGAVVGGGTEEEIERLRKYGRFIGLAFQVCDDVLDAIGSTEKMGKKVGRDLVRDKATYVKLMGVDESRKFARQLVAQANEELACFDSTLVAPLSHIANFILGRAI